MSEVESRTAPLKFLVVEDHPEVAQNNCEWLQRIAADAQCIAVSNPMDAIRRLQREQPDLVVVDLLYGQTSGEQSAEPGLELLRHIFENYPTLNVMVYSSEPLLLTPLVGLISKHQGGFAAVNKMERRSVFLEGAKSALNGELRFRVLDYVREKPFRIGLVEWIEDEPPQGDLQDLVAQVSTLLQEVVRLSSKLMEREAALPDSLPTDPVELSYWVASHFRGAPRDQQALLEMVSTEARLRREAEILESACKHLAARTALKDLFSKSS